MNSLLFLLLTVATVALAQDDVRNVGTLDEFTLSTKDIVHEMNLSKIFDTALPNIRKYITRNGMDPMDLPDIEIPLSHLPGLLKTKLILHRGHIQQLSTIIRTGDIILQYNEKKMSLYLNIGWEMLDLSHEYSLRYLLFTRRGDCYGRYEDIKARMLIDFDCQKKKIDLKFLKFMGIGNFEFKLEGHTIDPIINTITKAVTKIFRTDILRIIESKAYEEIDKKIQEINELIPSPIDCKFTAIGLNHDHELLNDVSYNVNGLESDLIEF